MKLVSPKTEMVEKPPGNLFMCVAIWTNQIASFDLGPDSGAKICSFESFFEYFSNSFVKEVFKGAFKGAFNGAKFLHQNRDPVLFPLRLNEVDDECAERRQCCRGPGRGRDLRRRQWRGAQQDETAEAASRRDGWNSWPRFSRWGKIFYIQGSDRSKKNGSPIKSLITWVVIGDPSFFYHDPFWPHFAFNLFIM